MRLSSKAVESCPCVTELQGSGSQLFLLLFCTGIRFRKPMAGQETCRKWHFIALYRRFRESGCTGRIPFVLRSLGELYDSSCKFSGKSLDGWRIKTKFSIQYSLSAVHNVRKFSNFVEAGWPALHTDESVFTESF